MDFDPRDYDTRDNAPKDFSQDDNLTTSAPRERAHDDHPREPGRGPGDSRSDHDGQARDDARWPERSRDSDMREVFMRGLNLPRGPERELVHDRHRRGGDSASQPE